MPRKASALPPRELLAERFSYDPDTGIILRKQYPGMRTCHFYLVGAPAGYLADTGYIQIGIGRKLYYGHRIAFKIHTGEEPAELDHRDGDTSNNRFKNLRPATHAQNACNKRVKTGKATPLGVHRSRSKFQAKIGFRGKTICLGTFDTVEAASAAHKAKSAELFGEFSKHASEAT